MSDLLPHNATPQERAISATVGRVGAVAVPIRDEWNADLCPPNLLPHLAWAFSVDQWDAAWTDAQKRETIKRSVDIHRHKGTVGAVKDALGALFIGARVQEWFNQAPAGDPYTFRILLEADQIGMNQSDMARVFEIVNRTKNLRSHLSEVEVSVRSVAGPRVAIAAGVGSEIAVTNFRWTTTVISETTIVI